MEERRTARKVVAIGNIQCRINWIKLIHARFSPALDSVPQMAHEQQILIPVWGSPYTGHCQIAPGRTLARLARR